LKNTEDLKGSIITPRPDAEVIIPEAVDDASVRQRLLNEYNIEIGSGLELLKGKIWRIGLMGHSCTEENVSLVLKALTSL